MVGDAFSFNAKGDQVIYVAEPKAPKHKGFF